MLHTDTGRMGGGSQAKEIVSKDSHKQVGMQGYGGVGADNGTEVRGMEEHNLRSTPSTLKKPTC